LDELKAAGLVEVDRGLEALHDAFAYLTAAASADVVDEQWYLWLAREALDDAGRAEEQASAYAYVAEEYGS
jgi:hypothetical protein